MSGSLATPSGQRPKIKNIADLYAGQPLTPRKLMLSWGAGTLIGHAIWPTLGIIKNGLNWPHLKSELWRITKLSYVGLGTFGIGYCLFGYEQNEAAKRTLAKKPKAQIKDLLKDPYYQGHTFRTNFLLKSNKLFHPSLKLPDQ